MSTWLPGKVYALADGDMELPLPADMILVWRESLRSELVFCDGPNQLPKTWLNDTKKPFKIIGRYKKIREVFTKFALPPGSKLIALENDAIIRILFSKNTIQFMGKRKKRIAIIDDSATMRKLLAHLVSQFDGWEVVAEASGAEGINQLIETHYPDLVTLDLNMGDMNGAVAMRTLLAPKKIPTLLISSQGIKDGGLVMEALAAGALDYLQKPESGKWELLKEDMLEKMEAALKFKWSDSIGLSNDANISIETHGLDLSQHLIVIGSSTGGTQALEEIFTRLPEKIPPILVTQHIPAGFSKALAERLNKLCPFEVKEAQDGDEVKEGRVLIAPGDHHMRLRGGGKNVEIINSEPVNRFRPSVDVMFASVAKSSKLKVIAVMLTGMGKDGSKAMLELRLKGALTIAQDEASSVVFGMPKEAIRIGAAEHVKPLLEIPGFLYKCISKRKIDKL